MPATHIPIEGPSLPVLLRRARDAYAAALRAALESAGYDDLPRHGPAVLVGVIRPSGDRPLSALIAELGVPKQSAGQLVDALVLRGYLTRDVDLADRRRLTIGVTARGRAAGHVVATVRDAIDRELRARVGASAVDTLRHGLAVIEVIARTRAECHPPDVRPTDPPVPLQR